MRGERGVALLEALVALSVLATAGIGLVALARAAVDGELRSAATERTLGAADRVLTATTLLRRPELDQRLGEHQVGDFLVRIQRPGPTLFRLAISEASTPSVELLVTVVYRPAPSP
jgi:hypothetical protein